MLLDDNCIRKGVRTVGTVRVGTILLGETVKKRLYFVLCLPSFSTEQVLICIWLLLVNSLLIGGILALSEAGDDFTCYWDSFYSLHFS